ncbi:MAG TPA: hypothetical protein DCS63_04450 [Elusimicrobia bacterium]|nr:hypothetical protein [Elusimicrobiota bacterium]
MQHRIALFTLVFISFFASAHGGWWIFGQSANEVKINYLYVCGASMDEAGPKVKIPRSALKDGQALVKGRATVRKGTIGAVQISLTDPADWQKAKLSSDGTFEYTFAPEAGKIYKFSVKAMDTAGKTSDAAATERDIEFTDMDIRAEIVKALDAMIAAYQAEDPAAFMAHVSQDFTGDTYILDTAVRKDFSALSEIRLAYTLSGIASGQGGKTAASINYRRQVISSRDGKPYSDSGTTEFVFKQGEKGCQVYSMKSPLIFGLSLADEVGTGTTTQPPGGGDIIVVTGGGDVTTVPPDDIGTEPTEPILAYSKTISNDESFYFETGTSVAGPGGDIAYNAAIPAPPGSILFKPGTTSYQLGVINIETTKTTPNRSTYVSMPAGPLMIDGGYALYLTSGKYVVLQITVINSPSSITIKYKYQPNGTNLF